ncbi:unnamed protein product [Mycena citricolor]|uniref:Uncharacterized protein n=1 Tax=Mycena citricolor TaxID=2018698 RepID=A0AAD2HDS2_9AGAR|nr:unnamed protein product [Mycena citricolor]
MSHGSTHDLPKECRISEIMQYICTPQRGAFGPSVHCTPVPRLFRICPNIPAVEVTRVLNIDLATGDVAVPKDLSSQLPTGKAWCDVVKHDKIQEPKS